MIYNPNVTKGNAETLAVCDLDWSDDVSEALEKHNASKSHEKAAARKNDHAMVSHNHLCI